MKTKRIIWTVVFLGITLVAIVMEVLAGVFHVGGTIPWTEYIAAYVPWPFQLAAYVLLAVWLPFHFWRADDKAKRAYRDGLVVGRETGRAEAIEAAATMLSDQATGNAAQVLRPGLAKAAQWVRHVNPNMIDGG